MLALYTAGGRQTEYGTPKIIAKIKIQLTKQKENGGNGPAAENLCKAHFLLKNQKSN